MAACANTSIQTIGIIPGFGMVTTPVNTLFYLARGLLARRSALYCGHETFVDPVRLAGNGCYPHRGHPHGRRRQGLAARPGHGRYIVMFGKFGCLSSH
jgi:hypothetical protein